MACLALGGVAQAKTEPVTIYSGGPIVTLAGDAPELVEAVAVRGGTIIATGSSDSVRTKAGRKAVQVDLKGKTMLPGFIDAHGHVSLLGRFMLMADLSSPPVGAITTIAQLQDTLRAYMEEHPEGPILGRGYDDAMLVNGQHPTRHDLDAVSSDRPIVLMHVSGHLATANSAMLQSMGIGPGTPDPKGGKIRREADGKMPSGVLEEAAMMAVFRQLFPPDLETNVSAIVSALKVYAAHGITTAQDGAVRATQWPIYQAIRQRDLPIDIAVLVMGVEDLPSAITDEIGGEYKGRVRIAGLKFVGDGSPQGRTAWLSAPYHRVPDGKPADYRGYPAIDLPEFQRKLAEAAKNGWQVFTHVNGDAAAQALIDSVRMSGLAGKRTIAIHNQVVRPEQLAQMQELDIHPSFFANHTYFWGDWHRDVVLGGKRADFISPQASAWRVGLRPTAHNDAPVVPPDMMRLVWSSTNRRTQSGDILGPEERISTYRALRQVTINAAWQIHEDDEKGSIETGKQADFVILDHNPLDYETARLHEIGVVATINDGKTVFGTLD
ncbi:MAG: amidohydrolase [Sphingomonadaceae bacterium]|nr:amidohydrolase [Sphingomonadaceae bacterium]